MEEGRDIKGRFIIGHRNSKEIREKMSNSRTGNTHSEETKKKIKEKNLKTWKRKEVKDKVSGKNNWGYGKHLSEVTKDKIKIARTKQVITDSMRDNMRKSALNNLKIGKNKAIFKSGRDPWNKGKKGEYSEEYREKISKNSKKLWSNPDWRSKHIGINHPNYGKNHSEKSKELIRMKHLGIKHSKEHIDKLKIARHNRVFPTKDTTIEVKIQNFLKQLNIEFFTHQYIKEIEQGYQCDIMIPVQEGINQKTIIECDGDYWHGNLDFYRINQLPLKIQVRRILDFERTSQLEETGWRIIRLWEHEIKDMELNELGNILKCQ